MKYNHDLISFLHTGQFVWESSHLNKHVLWNVWVHSSSSPSSDFFDSKQIEHTKLAGTFVARFIHLSKDEVMLWVCFCFLRRHRRQVQPQHHTIAILLKENSIFLIFSLPKQCKKTKRLKEAQPSTMPWIEKISSNRSSEDLFNVRIMKSRVR